MKKLFISTFFTITGCLLFAQDTNVCGTPLMDSVSFMNKPWVGNNQFLLDLIDSVGYGGTQSKKDINGNSPMEGGFDSQVKYWVPVKAWVYYDSQGDNIGDEEVELSIEELNEYFAGRVNDYGAAHAHTKIQFYLK